MTGTEPGNSADQPKQRKNPRARFFSTINMVFIDSKTRARLSGQEHFRIHRADIKDLSSTAMMIRTCDFNPQLEMQLLSGAVFISLRFSLPGYTSPIDTTVQVMHIKEEKAGAAVFYNIGMKFLQVKPIDQAAIDRYLKGYGKKDI